MHVWLEMLEIPESNQEQDRATRGTVNSNITTSWLL